MDIVNAEDKTRVLQFLTTGAREHDDHPARTEFRMRHCDDFWMHAEAVCTNLLHDENVRGIVLNIRDVSSGRHSRSSSHTRPSTTPSPASPTEPCSRTASNTRSNARHATRSRCRCCSWTSTTSRPINDSLGHAAGDLVLGEVGERLTRVPARRGHGRPLRRRRVRDPARGLDRRHRGDRGRGAHPHSARRRVPAREQGGVRPRERSASRPPTSAPKAGPEGAEELLRNADVAMYMAKEAGKGRYQVFEPAMHDTALRRLELKADLQRAIDSNEFTLHYQPIIVLQTGEIVRLRSARALAAPERGLVAAARLRPARRGDRPHRPDRHAGCCARRAASARDLQDRYPKAQPLHMAVNLSGAPAAATRSSSRRSRRFSTTRGSHPTSLVIEITESVMMQDMELSIQRLGELKELGMQLAVDDFGIGYSSLNYIRRFPVDILKVDKSFIDGVADSGEESALTAAIIELAGHPAPAAGRRRHRASRAGRAAARAPVRAGPGLLLRQADADRRHPRAAARAPGAAGARARARALSALPAPLSRS